MAEIGSVLMETAVRAAALGLGAGALLALWRRRPPAVAHTVWAGVVLGMLTLPAVAVLAPRLVLEVPPAARDAPQAASFAVPADVREPSAGSASLGRGLGGAERSRGFDWPWLAAGLYLGVASLMLASLARGGLAVRRLARTSRVITDPHLRSLAGALLPGRSVVLASSPAVRVPLTAGWLRPRVFLPESWKSWSGEQRRAVLAHELSHVRRGDFLWIFLAELNKCAYWFHPLAWIARRRLATAAERASDDDAASHLGSRTAYARLLVEVAALVPRDGRRVAFASVALPMASPSSPLARRVEDVLASSGRRDRRRSRFVAALALGMLAALAGTLEIVAEPPGATLLAARTGAEADFDRLIAELRHPDPERRARAAIELSLDESRLDEAIPHLIALLGDDTKIREMPRHRWRFSDNRGWVPAKYTWLRPSPGEAATIALASMSSLAAEPLAALLDHGDPVVRRNAAWGLGELRHPRGIAERGIAELAAALDDPDASVRAAVAWSLGDIRVRAAVPGLIEALRNDPDARVRAMAAHALGEVRAAEAEAALAEAARRDPRPTVLFQALDALEEVREHGY